MERSFSACRPVETRRYSAARGAACGRGRPEIGIENVTAEPRQQIDFGLSDRDFGWQVIHHPPFRITLRSCHGGRAKASAKKPAVLHGGCDFRSWPGAEPDGEHLARQ